MRNPPGGKYIIFDIDGTLADASHRLHYLDTSNGKKKDWKNFFKEARYDKPFRHVLFLNHLYGSGLYGQRGIIAMTGRPEAQRDLTVAWLDNNDVIFDHLYMRPEGDFRPDYETKQFLLKRCKEELPIKEIECAFEDRLEVARMWRANGIPVFLCGDEWLGKTDPYLFEGILQNS